MIVFCCSSVHLHAIFQRNRLEIERSDLSRRIDIVINWYYKLFLENLLNKQKYRKNKNDYKYTVLSRLYWN